LKTTDLDFDYPERLVAKFPEKSRIMYFVKTPSEITKLDLFEKIKAGDTLVVNDTKVIPRRVFSETQNLEVLFLNELQDNLWSVLFPASRLKGKKLKFPGNLEAELVESGLPQKIHVTQKLNTEYFLNYGEPPLPPYIQKARNQRHCMEKDFEWYQTKWAEIEGSVAAPTASLHFSSSDLDSLNQMGVNIQKITLHVGAGTFFPVKTENLEDHPMHTEYFEIDSTTWENILKAKNNKKKIWALGTTVTRALESAALSGKQNGHTDLMITPGFDFQMVQGLLTNFHQPRSTLLALVAAFAGLENVKQAYQWAIEKKYRLFSYGDLTVWEKVALITSV
jgi:S-adenosylmethionine:tRNA ribosyltransferase-isomerase